MSSDRSLEIYAVNERGSRRRIYATSLVFVVNGVELEVFHWTGPQGGGKRLCVRLDGGTHFLAIGPGDASQVLLGPV